MSLVTFRRNLGPSLGRHLPILCGLVLLTTCTMARAQSPGAYGYYSPLHHTAPPGMIAQWQTTINRSNAGYFQPVRVELPSQGTVVYYSDSGRNESVLPAPAQVGLLVGHTYRLKIADMPEYPGVELYPTLEVIDRLHPPVGQIDRYPIPVRFSSEEIEYALDGRMVTRVIYLEQPQLAYPGMLSNGRDIRDVDPGLNLLEEADIAGRPMLIIRLGGRMPPIEGYDPSFFGSGAPVAAQPNHATGQNGGKP